MATTTYHGAWRSRRARDVAGGQPGNAVPRTEFGERPHRDRSPTGDAERDGEESEPLAGKTAEGAEVLDDEHSGSKEPRPSLRREVGGVVYVPEIDADEGGTAVDEEIEHLDVKVRPGLPIPRGPPALVPARPDDDRLVLDGLPVELECDRAGLSGGIHHYPRDAGDGAEGDPAQIVSVLEAVERCVKTRRHMTLCFEARWVLFEDMTKLDEPRHLTAPIAAGVTAARAPIHVDGFVLLVAAGAVPVCPGSQPGEPGRAAPVTDQVAVDSVRRRGSSRPEEALLEDHVAADPRSAVVAEEAEVSSRAVDDPASHKSTVVEPDHHALPPGRSDIAVDPSALHGERDIARGLCAAPVGAPHRHISLDPPGHEAHPRVDRDLEVRRECAADRVAIRPLRAIDRLLQVPGMGCARSDNTHQGERHNCGNNVPAHEVLTPFRALAFL